MTESKQKLKSAPTASTSILMNQVADKFNEIPKHLVKSVLTSFLNSIEDHVASGSKVRIDKLGILAVKDAAARRGRNPQTGEAIDIPARKRISFHTSISLKTIIGIKKKK